MDSDCHNVLLLSLGVDSILILRPAVSTISDQLFVKYIYVLTRKIVTLNVPSILFIHFITATLHFVDSQNHSEITGAMCRGFDPCVGKALV